MRQLLSLLVVITVLGGCKKPPVELTVTSDFVNGFFALNEGLFQQNNASLSFYSLATQKMHHSVFSSINGRGLGDTANDMIQFTFNGKLYYAIAVNVSSQVEIIDGLTMESVAQIGLFDNGIGREPRSLQYQNDVIYSINFDGTVSLIDMNSLTETTTISVGDNPESSLIYQNKLYVINTGGLNFPNYDSTISVIDLQNNLVVDEFTCGLNGARLITDEAGDGYMIARGNYSNIEPKLVRLDLSNYKVEAEYNFNIVTMAYSNNHIYYYDDIENAIRRFDTQTETNNPAVFIDCSDFENVYNIQVNAEQQLVYVVDANGYVNSSIIRIYDMTGKFQREIISGLNSNSLVFSP
ncbi:MAG: YncE family protein [Crocinitomicaceae bacterium]